MIVKYLIIENELNSIKKHREKLSKNGRDNFLKKYNWEKISQKYLDV